MDLTAASNRLILLFRRYAMMFRSIRLRLSLSFAGIALIAALVLGAVLLAILQNYYANVEVKYLRGNAESIGQTVTAMLMKKAPHDEIQSQIENLAFLSQTRVQVYDPSGRLLYDSGSPQSVNVNLGVLKQLNAIETAGDSPMLRIISVGSSQTVPAKSPNAIVPVKPFDGNNVSPDAPPKDDKFFFVYRSVKVGESPFGFDLSSGAAPDNIRSNRVVAELIRNPQDGSMLGSVKLSEGPAYGSAILQSVARGWALASAIAVLLAAGIGWYISRRISAPVLELTGVTAHMRGGDLSSRANIQSRDEFGQLARSFNEMAEQVETTVTTLRRFVADASHELRTPLTALRTDLDLVLDEKDEASRAAFVADAKLMVQRLEELNTNLLDLSRLEANHHTSRDAVVNLTDLLRARGEIYASQAEQSGLTYEQDLPAESVFIHADANEILRAVDNLVDNACKFTPQDGTIRLTLSQQDERVVLCIADTGIGIPEDDLPQLFNRFHRGRNASAYRGSGLGLAIVKAIASAHGGGVEVQSAGVGQGSRFLVELPTIPEKL